MIDSEGNVDGDGWTLDKLSRWWRPNVVAKLSSEQSLSPRSQVASFSGPTCSRLKPEDVQLLDPSVQEDITLPLGKLSSQPHHRHHKATQAVSTQG